MADNVDNLLYLVHHLFLPPKLPQQNDYLAEREEMLLAVAIDGLVAWKSCVGSARHKEAESAVSALQNIRRTHSWKDGSLVEVEISSLLNQLEEGTAVPLLIREQNAGVPISRYNSRVLFEVFEISPQNEATLATKGRLKRSFLGAAVSISATDFQQDGLQATIAHTLADMSKHVVETVLPKVKKSGNILHEDRDTNHPGMVSEVFIGFLRSIGEAAESPVIAKNMRDDVLWADARSPWRRSPLWLLIRVALQLNFMRKTTPTRSDIVYKEAIIFVLTHALEISTRQSLSSDMLFSMNAKLARRQLKIGSGLDSNVLLRVEQAMNHAYSLISKRWSTIRMQDTRRSDHSQWSKLDFVNDSYVSLPKLDKYIRWMQTRQPENTSSSFQPSSKLIRFTPHDLPRLLQTFSGNKSYAAANLEAFETWVALHCRRWSQDNQQISCGELGALIGTYHKLARPHYSKNPEALSIMALTAFELWISCDEAAIRLCPMLGQYDPGIPCGVLQNLLLPFASQMQRLHDVEQYLASRSSSARFTSTKLYCDLDHPDSFSARFFDDSAELQLKHQEIIATAEREKDAKLAELRNQKEEYHRLMKLHDESECEQLKVLVDPENEFYESRHKSDCTKCEYKDRAANLEIHIQEWPLPRNAIHAKSIVFELHVPPYFQSWRRATFYILQDIIEMPYSAKKSPCFSFGLTSDRQLRGSLCSPSEIGLLSENKPQAVTHRKAQQVSTATESSVCLNSGLNYRYFDPKSGCFVERFLPSEKLPKMCTYLLPRRSKDLQKYLYRPASCPHGLSPNSTIAAQSETPQHMSIEEARELASVPLGLGLQFYNILIQLAAPSLDFKKEETAIFVLQCLYQAGPPGKSFLRACHSIVDDVEFACCLLESVGTAWHRIKENWESARALSVFIAITLRLLAVSSLQCVQEKCFTLLTTLRTGAFSWVQLLRDKSQKADTQEDDTYFKSQSVEIALICASSFDVEGSHLSVVLLSDANASIFTQCSIIIQEGECVYDPASELVLACLALRFYRLLYRSSSILAETLSGICDAVKKSWSAYRPGTRWRRASDSAYHWLITETARDCGGDHLQVHYDLLTGELLVNGLPLNRPPQQYETHPMWRTLFGHAAVEVMPTSTAGMEFSAKRSYKGYEVHLSLKRTLSGSTDLLVRAANSKSLYETVPTRVLQKIFPDRFITDFVHWYDAINGTLEVRALATPWTSDESTWILSKSSIGWKLTRKGCTVLGVGSATATSMATILSPLAEPFDIQVLLQSSTTASTTPSVEVEIPALQLGFYLTSGELKLRSREYRGMSIDDDQYLGTLVGLTNKLVLKSASQRVVLVPEGRVTWTSADNHVRVTVSKASIVRMHLLRVDGCLGRLIDDGSLQGKLFMAYLHALTSFCLPDPLTNSTGVEQALYILESAAVRSFERLSRENIDIMAEIARLTPARTFYPLNARVMQTVSWVQGLSSLSQHGGFYKAVKALFEQARQTSVFCLGNDSSQLVIQTHVDTNEHLLERERIRSSTFRISGFGAEEHTTAYDSSYRGRDRNQASRRGNNSYVLSSILNHKRTTLHTPSFSKGELWRVMEKVSTVLGPNQSLPVSQLRYSADAVNSGLDLSQWLVLHRRLSTHGDVTNKFSLMIYLSALAAHQNADMRFLQVLALIFTTAQLSDISLPTIQSCSPSKGYEATLQRLRNIVNPHHVPFKRSPEAELRADSGETRRSFERRRQKLFTDNQNMAVQTLVAEFRKQWPTDTPSSLDHVDQGISDYVRVTEVEQALRKKFKDWFNNLQLFEYLQCVEWAIHRLSCEPVVVHGHLQAVLAPPSRSHTFISIRDLFNGPAPISSKPLHPLKITSTFGNDEDQTSHLAELIGALKKTIPQSRYEVSYVEELSASMRSLQGKKSTSRPDIRENYPIETMLEHLADSIQKTNFLYDSLSSAAKAVRGKILEMGHGPRVSPLLFLQQLRKQSWQLLSPEWRVSIAHYGLALTIVQRAERILKAASSSSSEDLIRELSNVGHQAWEFFEYPEWLLLEVESGIMIRDVQAHIAFEMINPSSRCNAAMQLNMGEGKSSVIVPITAIELADGSQLTRVIVAKPQSKQMEQMLTSKLGGLLDRRIYHMPFSRALKIDSTATADTIGNIMRECMATGGILLVQPEHLLSFQLMGLECYCSTSTPKQTIGRSLIRNQDFFDNNSRDIIDESDENFSVKFELIYTMGSQRPIELSPDRWICIQHVLGLVRTLADDIAHRFPQSVEIHRYDGRFPRTRILRSDAGEALVEEVGRHICDRGFDGFPIARQHRHVREAVFKYITQYSLSQEEIDAVEDPCSGAFGTGSTKPLLLLLRGILAGGVLAFTLSHKRWRVNFGLAGSRTPSTRLAVPYRAKDNPTLRSEFSHPDVVILLTSLTYYYGGLEDEDLFIALGHLVDSDQADVEFDAWMRDSPSMPTAFRQLEGINLKDRPQCMSDVFPHLKYSKSVVDYFLGRIVFPKEMKQFPYKLSASGWDIGKAKAHYATGFSGTSDSRKLLPLDMKHLDLPSQSHTNALVLAYLLQPENSVILLPDKPATSSTDAERLLNAIVRLERGTRVILDVGAQILELNNQEVAETWLKMYTDPGAQAVVFVNDEDELSVIDRKGRVEFLQTSSYATQLGSCLVYLDEAHTRGIDLRLPEDYRAAVTLGAGLTKDKLVQACMRMRKLGKGQSVVFCVSAEIRTKIQECTAKATDAAIEVQDVLHWAISETFAETRKNMPLWAVQGGRFLRQDKLWKSVRTSGATSMSKSHAERFLEDEAQAIEARYCPRAAGTASVSQLPKSTSLNLDEIEERCSEFEHLQFNSSTLQEEQERELSPEIEQERQEQRPRPAEPAEHKLHPDIVTFVATGQLVPGSTAHAQAFNSLHDTSAATSFDVSQFSDDGRLFVTADFTRTVKHASGSDHVSDSFQRSVQWILSSHAGTSNVVNALIIISPYEAELLMSKLRSRKPGRVTLHLYKPRCHTVHRCFDRLDFLTIPTEQAELNVPRALLVQLNLFAGQLYFSTYEDYLEACKFLNLAVDVPKEDEVVGADGYILQDSDGKSKFNKSPTSFFRVLISKIRRNGQSISKTHVGSMLEGKLLQRSDIEGKQ